MTEAELEERFWYHRDFVDAIRAVIWGDDESAYKRLQKKWGAKGYSVLSVTGEGTDRLRAYCRIAINCEFMPENIKEAAKMRIGEK